MEEISLGSVPEIFGSNVRRLREFKEWSQSELARRMVEAGWPNYRQMTVSRTEDGTRTVRLDEALAYAELFAVELHVLLSSESNYQKIVSMAGVAEDVAGEVVGYEMEASEASLQLSTLLNKIDELIALESEESKDLSKFKNGVKLYRELLGKSHYAFLSGHPSGDDGDD